MYFFYVDQHIILTNGFIKKTQKTPRNEIEKAKNIRQIIWIERNRTMGRKFDDFLQEQLQDPKIRKEYEALQPEHTVIQAMIDARKKSGMTQKELAEITCIAQGDISKLKRGSCLFLRKCTVVPEERIPLFRSKYTVRPEQDTACIILASASLLA